MVKKYGAQGLYWRNRREYLRKKMHLIRLVGLVLEGDLLDF